MVKIAIAGGSSGVGQEIVASLAATKKHEILLLTRKYPDGTEPAQDGVTWFHADYKDTSQLASLLQGVHTVLSFVISSTSMTGGTPKSDEQKNLIDAAIQAGVKRFAPSEWLGWNLDPVPWYQYKKAMREYLKEVNKDKKVLEYCLFQPGIFTNYLAHPTQTSKHVQTMELNFDFTNRRAIVAEDSDSARITLTTIHDLAAVVTLAVEHQGEWPVVGGICGEEMTLGELLALGERIHGKFCCHERITGPFNVEKLPWNDLEAGILKASWRPEADHPAIPKDMTEAEKDFTAARFAMAIKAEIFAASDEWNKLLPDYRFTKVEEFVRSVVESKE
ncbi:hypothetical protein PspLS_08683 [Pyricularia sp. CBS 133598]|nr:hypothetical protein PspLS_08683 [Pyricularia sp. CBS 133598]